MDKIQVFLARWDDPAWYAQVACEVTRAANKYSSPAELLEHIEANKWSEEKVSQMLKLPHSKISRFTDFTFIITGTSRRFLAQLMTHHVGISVMSGSLQYSDHSKRHLDDMFVVPRNVIAAGDDAVTEFLETQEKCFEYYEKMRGQGIDNDTAGYTMPQSLRNVLLVKVNLEELKFIGNQRLCKRNTDETRYVIAKMVQEIVDKVGIDDNLFAPTCNSRPCPEGIFCCGKPIVSGFNVKDYLVEEFPEI